MVLGAEQAVDQSVRSAEVLLKARAASADLVRLMEEADAELGRRLLKMKPGKTTFEAATAIAYRRQIALVLSHVKRRLGGATTASAAVAVERGLRSTLRLLTALEANYAGVVKPLRLAQAAVMDRTIRGVRASLLGQHAASIDRYGMGMQMEFERVIRRGFVSGASQREMVMALTAHGGPKGTVSLAAKEVGGQVVRLREEFIPEGLFQRKRYWAERIVRTETAHAYNSASLEGLFVERDDFPDLGKKILATFDDRTAYDSIAVHGQIRKLEDDFEDGAGRHYLRPPARPNDRETVIPWRMPWSEQTSTKPAPVERQIAAKLRGTKRGNRSKARAQAATKARAERAAVKQAKKEGMP